MEPSRRANSCLASPILFRETARLFQQCFESVRDIAALNHPHKDRIAIGLSAFFTLGVFAVEPSEDYSFGSVRSELEK
jgi:hypothetical protein